MPTLRQIKSFGDLTMLIERAIRFNGLFLNNSWSGEFGRSLLLNAAVALEIDFE